MGIDPRREIFAAVRAAARPGLFDDKGNVLALDNLLDAFDVARAGSESDHRLRDPAAFYKRARLVTGSLTQLRVDSVELILKAGAALPLAWMAYVLATAWHESRFEPQEEWGRGDGKRYGKPGARLSPDPAKPRYAGIPFGRGFVQLTWVENYEWADKALGLDGALLANFDLAMKPDIAARVLVQGMVDGAFTGKKLADYLPAQPTIEQYENARRIVNGTDKASTIAAHASAFENALRAGRWQ